MHLLEAVQAQKKYWSDVAADVHKLIKEGESTRADEDLWPSLQRDIFGSRQIVENDGVVQLDAPARAEDAAVVPPEVLCQTNANECAD